MGDGADAQAVGFTRKQRAPVNRAADMWRSWVKHRKHGPAAAAGIASRQSIRSRQRLFWLLPLALPVPAFADLSVQASGTAHYEYNSNVYQVTSSSGLPAGTAGNGLGDWYLAEAGNFAVADVLGNQQLYLTLSGDRAEYNHFTALDHTDYAAEGGWDWKFGSIWDGFLDVSRTRSMVSFYNLIGPNLVLQTEQREVGKIRLQFVPDWRTAVTGMTRKVDQPQVNEPGLSVSESSGRWDLEYVGTAGLTSGVTASYLSGSFSGTQGFFAPSYTQRSGGLTVTDDISGRSTLRGEIGYTSRSSENGSDNISGGTGDLDYRINLTGKTTAELELSRLINVYLTNTAAEIDDVAALRLIWQATYKIGVNLQYSYTDRELPGQGNAPLGAERVDHLNIGQITVTYKPVAWLVLQPYFQYQSLASYHNVGANFNSKSAGIEFTVQWEEGKIPDHTPVIY
jgi:hypothetical protein